MHSLSIAFIDSFPVVILFVVGCGVAASYHLNDAHVLNRVGALIAAISAAAILVQIKMEQILESQVQHLKEQEEDSVEAAIGPVGDLTVRIRHSRRAKEESAARQHRLKLAATVVFGAFFGELLHGFGDVAMCIGLQICARH